MDDKADVPSNVREQVARGPYHRLLQATRRRPSEVTSRDLEEEASADRGRVLFSAPFRRLQNKAQVFSLETNAAVRSRLTHSLEVSSIGGLVAQEAVRAFRPEEREALGIAGNERAMLTFVETACLLHDLGNPPFGHFGEIAISDWFHQHQEALHPPPPRSATRVLWDQHYCDLLNFDGNPQGFRIVTTLQAAETGNLLGLNLTATTLAAMLKYPWVSTALASAPGRKKAGYFHTEERVVGWLRDRLGIEHEARHPLVFLMEAADDIAYCLSDIEDGIEKGLISPREFADHMRAAPLAPAEHLSDTRDAQDVSAIQTALARLHTPQFERAADKRLVERLTAMQDLRGAVIRLLARRAGRSFEATHTSILAGKARPLLNGAPLLEALRQFAERLYMCSVVRQRELTAHAVLSGLLDAYFPLMECDRDRWQRSLDNALKDQTDRRIGRERSLVSRIAKKYLAVYREVVRQSDEEFNKDNAAKLLMERLHRMRLVVDYISGMTDEFALQSYQLVSGVHVSPHRN